jgi:hypothetical protein
LTMVDLSWKLQQAPAASWCCEPGFRRLLSTQPTKNVGRRCLAGRPKTWNHYPNLQQLVALVASPIRKMTPCTQ